jgi:GntR family phosphonate transport system transcriptional regulator
MDDSDVTERSGDRGAKTEAPLWRRIAEDLETAIRDGAHPAGSTLPTALELAGQYRVHRHTVRQALSHLQSIGLVSVRQGRGTLVTGGPVPYRIGRTVSFRENFKAAGLVTTGRVLEADRRTAESDIAEQLELLPGEPIWRIRIINEAGGMPVSTAVHRLSLRRFPRFADDLAAGGGSITAAMQAAGITHFERLSTRISARLAKPKERRLLDLPDGAPVLVTRGVDALADRTPVNVVESVFAAARVEFLIEPDRMSPIESGSKADR